MALGNAVRKGGKLEDNSSAKVGASLGLSTRSLQRQLASRGLTLDLTRVGSRASVISLAYARRHLPEEPEAGLYFNDTVGSDMEAVSMGRLAGLGAG